MHNEEKTVEPTNPDYRPVSRIEFVSELKSFRSDVRLLVLASVALNQFLSNVSLPSGLTAGVVAAWLGKSVVSAIVASRG